MKKIFICLLTISFLISSSTILSATSSHQESEHRYLIASSNSFWQTPNNAPESTTLFSTSFASTLDYSDWTFGAFDGPQLWHITSVDAWAGDQSLGCFDSQSNHYANNMEFNYALAPITIEMKDVLDMEVDFYCKYITRDSNDYWGIVIYDPSLDVYLAHVWNAPQSWQQIPYETYGYHPTWMGPMQPLGQYQSFNILDAYDHWYNQGYFRDPHNGSKTYELQIGFMMYETDGTGYTNDEADQNEIYWSGLFIDNVSIQQLIVNNPPQTPTSPLGPSDGVTDASYFFSTNTLDSDDDQVRYGWDWNGDDFVDEWSTYIDSGDINTQSHSWSNAGEYSIQVKAEDEHGEQSEFSQIKTIEITENNEPYKPNQPSGPTSGKTGTAHIYSSSTIDPEGHQLYYFFDWGDGTDSGWVGPKASGESIAQSHIWETPGSYYIKVKAIDDPNNDGDYTDGKESLYSESLPITMKKSKIRLLTLEQFFQQSKLFNQLFLLLSTQ
jgi:hypothetical protein